MSLTDTAIKAKLLPYKIAAAIAVAIVLTILVMWGIGEFNTMRNAAAKSELQDTKAETAQGITQDAGKAQAATGKVEIVVTDARSAYNAAEQEALNNEPDTRDWHSQPTRDSLRNAARKRRLARERSSNSELRDEAEYEEEASSER